jgi:hypothetical protein
MRRAGTPIRQSVAMLRRLCKLAVLVALGLALAILSALTIPAQATDRLTAEDPATIRLRAEAFPAMARGFLLYREIALALIDQHRLRGVEPIDQAADAFGILMLTGPDLTPEIDPGYTAARLYWLRTERASARTDPKDEHIRYSRVLCLVVGANPTEREQFGLAHGLSTNDVRECGVEYRRWAETWRGALDPSTKPFYPVGSQTPFRFDGAPSSHQSPVPDDVRLAIPFRLNRLGVALTLPKPTPIVFRTCGTSKVGYDPSVPEIVFCYEMLRELERLGWRLN